MARTEGARPEILDVKTSARMRAAFLLTIHPRVSPIKRPFTIKPDDGLAFR